MPITDPLADGTYTVTWRVVSVDDGHVTAGAFAFGVGTPPGAPAATDHHVVVGSDAAGDRLEGRAVRRTDAARRDRGDRARPVPRRAGRAAPPRRRRRGRRAPRRPRVPGLAATGDRGTPRYLPAVVGGAHDDLVGRRHGGRGCLRPARDARRSVGAVGRRRRGRDRPRAPSPRGARRRGPDAGARRDDPVGAHAGRRLLGGRPAAPRAAAARAHEPIHRSRRRIATRTWRSARSPSWWPAASSEPSPSSAGGAGWRRRWTRSYGRILAIKVTVVVLVIGLGAYNRMRSLRKLGTDARPLRRIAAAELLAIGGVLLLTATLTSLAPPEGEAAAATGAADERGRAHRQRLRHDDRRHGHRHARAAGPEPVPRRPWSPTGPTRRWPPTRVTLRLQSVTRPTLPGSDDPAPPRHGRLGRTGARPVGRRHVSRCPSRCAPARPSARFPSP